MTNFQKAGGIAAIGEALAYITGFTIFLFLLDASDYVGPVRRVAFLIENQTIIFVANQIIYIGASILLLVLVLALHERLKDTSPAMMQVATALGVIWSGLVVASGMVFNIGMETAIDLYASNPEQAAVVWLSVGAVHDALGGGNEIVGGVWSLLLSLAALQAGKLNKALNYLGVVIGVAGILSVVPALETFTAVFGLAQIIWFAWVGVIMLRSPSNTAGG